MAETRKRGARRGGRRSRRGRGGRSGATTPTTETTETTSTTEATPATETTAAAPEATAVESVAPIAPPKTAAPAVEAIQVSGPVDEARLTAALCQALARETLLLDLFHVQSEQPAEHQIVWRDLAVDAQARQEALSRLGEQLEADLTPAGPIHAVWALETDGWLGSMGDLDADHRNPAQEASAVAALADGDWQALEWLAASTGDARLREVADKGARSSQAQRARLRALAAATLS